MSKVIAAAGEKQVGSVTSGERGNNVTIIACINALGNSVPPILGYILKILCCMARQLGQLDQHIQVVGQIQKRSYNGYNILLNTQSQVLRIKSY